MLDRPSPDVQPPDPAARERRLEMQHLQAIEGNPPTAEEIAMFDMFEREGWSEAQELAHINELIDKRIALKSTE